MAVVQISRIQVRRGKKGTSNVPQLASGEFGWAVDSQELYIGNGSVAEGAPQVGNTKVVTEHDDLFTLADEYTYKSGDGSIITGPDAANPVTRSLQDRLDDRISVRAFGLTGNAAQNATVLLQRAIDQLFFNGGAELNEEDRLVLHMEPGVYTINGTIYLPPYTTIVGAGEEKTIIRQTNVNASVFTTVGEGWTPGATDQNAIHGIDRDEQSRYLRLEGMTLEVQGGSKGLVLNSCRDSHFEHIRIKGANFAEDVVPADTKATYSIGLELNAKDGSSVASAQQKVVTTNNNEFIHCEIEGFNYGIVSNWDAKNNSFDSCTFKELGLGVAFGQNMTVDELYGSARRVGPSNNSFNGCVFNTIQKQAIYIANGVNNISHQNKYYLVGVDGGNEELPVYSILKFDHTGNESSTDYFARTRILCLNQGSITSATTAIVNGGTTVTLITGNTEKMRRGMVLEKLSGSGEFGVASKIDTILSDTSFSVTVPHQTSTSLTDADADGNIDDPLVFQVTSNVIDGVVYVPEVEGPCNFEWGFDNEVSIQGTGETLFRLPNFVNQTFEVDYFAIAEQGYNGVRSGKLRITLNAVTDAPNGTPKIIVSDDFDYVGDNVYIDSLSFDATIVDVDADTDYDTIKVKTIASGMPANAKTKFKFRVKTRQTVL